MPTIAEPKAKVDPPATVSRFDEGIAAKGGPLAGVRQGRVIGHRVADGRLGERLLALDPPWPADGRGRKKVRHLFDFRFVYVLSIWCLTSRKLLIHLGGASSAGIATNPRPDPILTCT